MSQPITNFDALGFRDFDTAAREKLADKGAALPDGSFPIVNKGDLANAIKAIGRAKDRNKAMAHIKKRARALGATDMLPQEWSSKMSAVAFSDTVVPQVQGDLVIRNGLLFQLGDYPDKNFSLTESEADAAISSFAPVPLNVEHIPSIFDGKLGEVRKVWRAGDDLYAEYAVPKWLYDVTEGEPIKVSAEWDRESKTLVGTGLVLHPRVQSAAMMAAFSHAAPSDLAEFAARGVAELHDMAVYHGAECGGKSHFADRASFMTKEELGTIQKVHDCCSGNGNHCDRYASMRSLYAQTADTDTTQSSTTARFRAKKENNPMYKWWETLKARFSSQEGEPPTKEEIASVLFAKMDDDDDDCDDDDMDAKKAKKKMDKSKMGEDNGASVASGGAAMKEDSAAFTAMQSELASLKALFAQTQETVKNQQQVIAEQQAQFAAQQKDAAFAADTRQIDGWVRAGKMTPAEADEWRKVAQETPAAFAAAKPALEARTAIAAFGRGMLGVVDGETARQSVGNANPDADKLIALAKSRQKDTGEPYHAAFSAVCKENPALAMSYRESEQRKSPHMSMEG